MEIIQRPNRRDRNRRYISTTTSRKKTKDNDPSSINKQKKIAPLSNLSPVKSKEELSSVKANQSLTLKKLVDRFRADEPQSREERQSINSHFWWLHDELQSGSRLTENDLDQSSDGNERHSNIPHFIEIFPSTDIDQDLNKRASILLNQTFSGHSSDTGHISSTGVGSTMTMTNPLSTLTMISNEQTARPSFTRIPERKLGYEINEGDDDILYQWRLRRRLEQAQQGERIRFQSQMIDRCSSNPSLAIGKSDFNVENVRSSPMRTFSSSSPPRKDREISSKPTEIQLEIVPKKQFAEMSTQTIQDASSQTSFMINSTSNCFNEKEFLPIEIDHRSNSSLCLRPEIRSKCEIVSSSSPSKRTEKCRRLIVDDSIQSHCDLIHLSADSTLTQVTKILPSPKQRQSIQPTFEREHCKIVDQSIDFNDDQLLKILQAKRDELLREFTQIEEILSNHLEEDFSSKEFYQIK